MAAHPCAAACQIDQAAGVFPNGPSETAYKAAALVKMQAQSNLTKTTQTVPFILPLNTDVTGNPGPETGKFLKTIYAHDDTQRTMKNFQDRFAAARGSPCYVVDDPACWAVALPGINQFTAVCVVDDDPHLDNNGNEQQHPTNPNRTIHFVQQHPPNHVIQHHGVNIHVGLQLHCNCSDFAYRGIPHSPIFVCKHIIAAYEHVGVGEHVLGMPGVFLPLNPAIHNNVP